MTSQELGAEGVMGHCWVRGKGGGSMEGRVEEGYIKTGYVEAVIEEVPYRCVR